MLRELSKALLQRGIRDEPTCAKLLQNRRDRPNRNTTKPCDFGDRARSVNKEEDVKQLGGVPGMNSMAFSCVLGEKLVVGIGRLSLCGLE